MEIGTIFWILLSVKSRQPNFKDNHARFRWNSSTSIKVITGIYSIPRKSMLYAIGWSYPSMSGDSLSKFLTAAILASGLVGGPSVDIGNPMAIHKTTTRIKMDSKHQCCRRKWTPKAKKMKVINPKGLASLLSKDRGMNAWSQQRLSNVMVNMVDFLLPYKKF